MIAGSLSRRYATALVDVAAASQELEAIAQDLHNVWEVLRAQRELRLFFLNPSILPRDKLAVFERIVSAIGLRPLTITFLRIVLEAGRLGILEGILRAYEALVDERLGRIKAVVTAAAPLPADQAERLRERLGQVAGKQVYLEIRQDPGILGGLIAQIGSLVYDGSVRTQLLRLRGQLAQG